MTLHIDLRKRRGSAKDKTLSPEERKLLLETITKPQHRIIIILEGFGAMRTEETAQCRFKWLQKMNYDDQEVLAINIPSEDTDTRDKKKKWYNTETKINKATNFNKFKTKVREPRTTYIFETNLIHEVFEWFRNNPDGLQMTRQNIATKIVTKHFRPLIDNLRIENGLSEEEVKKKSLTSHGLRATAINYLKFEKQMQEDVIGIMVGHKDIRTTHNHYKSMTRQSVESYLVGYFKK